MHEFISMCLFAEVEMGSDCVLKKMHDQITGKNKEGRSVPGKLRALGNHLQDRGRQHEPRSQRHKIFQVGPAPVLLDNDEPAKAVCNGSGQTKHETKDKWTHSRTSKQQSRISECIYGRATSGLKLRA